MELIPEEFHSLETDSIFSHCCSCKKELIISSSTYMVQKSFDGNECVMEYALCRQCKEDLDNQMSDESKEVLFNFIVDNAKRDLSVAPNNQEEAMAYIEECLTCSKHKKDCQSHSYSGLFVGRHMMYAPTPMMICGSCQEDVAENLSEETKEVRDKFLRENFPGPPSEIGLPTKGKPIFL